MCGIAGYFDRTDSVPDTAAVTRMTDMLAHRGPDDEGSVLLSSNGGSCHAVLGSRRLAILDLSKAAAQPFSSDDGTISLVFNGEIYNFKAVRAELEAAGHRFRSSGDTEVMLRAYEEYGEAFVAKLDGMFAFALWDGRERKLILGRDRAGKKPLFYAWNGSRLTFASETRPLRAQPWVDSSLDWSRIGPYLATGYVPWPATMHREIRQLPPGSSLVVTAEGIGEPASYWKLRFASAGEGSTDMPEAAGRVRELLTTAVEKRLQSDVPLGVLLSGGLDSSAIVAILAELGESVHTFTIGIGDEASFDERRYARLVAKQFGTRHTEVTVRADAAELLDRVVWFLDQPLADSSAIPTYLISRAAREHVTVALTGDGGDEVFGGYERFAAALLADSLPSGVQAGLGGVARVLPRTRSYFDLRTRIERFSKDPNRSPEQRYLDWVGVTPRPLVTRLLSPELRNGTGHLELTASQQEALREAGDAPLLHRLLFMNYRTYLHDDVLVKADRMTMANSLEARSPLLDTSLTEYVAGLAPELKTTRFGMKRVLREAMKGLVPDPILKRRKHGFGVPIDRWFRGELSSVFRDRVLDPGARVREALDLGVVSSMFSRHLEGKSDHGPELWSLLVLETWLRQLEGDVEAPPGEPAIAEVTA